MDELTKLLKKEPCYENHIVAIKQIYEEHLYSILIPEIYDGILSIYKKSIVLEKEFNDAAKNNPDIEPQSVLIIFQKCLKKIPSMNTHEMKQEYERIKSVSKCADIFDDIIKAVIKANITLLTYNIDSKRQNLLQTRYHENVIIHDFIHSCYIHSARMFFTRSELFYHKYEPIMLNNNKRSCHLIIKGAINDGIREMLPMKDILLEYNSHKYEQKNICEKCNESMVGGVNMLEDNYVPEETIVKDVENIGNIENVENVENIEVINDDKDYKDYKDVKDVKDVDIPSKKSPQQKIVDISFMNKKNNASTFFQPLLQKKEDKYEDNDNDNDNINLDDIKVV